jgi:hypothetical protein
MIGFRVFAFLVFHGFSPLPGRILNQQHRPGLRCRDSSPAEKYQRPVAVQVFQGSQLVGTWYSPRFRFVAICAVAYFSFLTPLNGVPSDFWSMKRPVSVSRLTQRSFCGLKVCDLPHTAPILWPSPVGGFFAIRFHLPSFLCVNKTLNEMRKKNPVKTKYLVD